MPEIPEKSFQSLIRNSDSSDPCPFCVAGWPVDFCHVRPGEGCLSEVDGPPVAETEEAHEALTEAPDDDPAKPDKTYKDARSTGRKRAAKLYPIEVGRVCDWAWHKLCGGGVFPIVGCTGRPATHIHHGPDKSTFTNTPDNISRICSYCHNRWHAANNPTYPEGRPDQGTPWLPLVEAGQNLYALSDMVPATREEVFANELSFPVRGKDLEAIADD